MNRPAQSKLPGIPVLLAALALVAAIGGAVAQTGPAAPSPLQGLSQNRDQPIQIQAATLEVRDKEKIATFTGNVHVVQGDTDLRCDLLIVYYEGDNIAAAPATGGRPAPVAATSAGKAAPVSGKPGGKQQIKRLEAKGSVMVTQNDQVATGDTGIFDTKANTITLSGKVTLTKGSNVIRGQRMVVNMVTGVAQVEGQSGGVRMLINPGEGGLAMDPPKPADPPKSAPARPARVNPR